MPPADLLDIIRKDYPADKVLGPIYKHLKDPTSATTKGGLRLTRNMFYIAHDNLMFRRNPLGEDRLAVPAGQATARLLQMYHDANVHVGLNKTLSALAPKFYIPQVKHVVQRYIRSCDTCQRNKQSNRPPQGLAMPLEAPTEPWQHISLDFLTGLPHSGPERYDAILVVIDRFTKSVVAIPCHKTVDAEQTAWLLINHIYQYHGAWHTITSDRGPQFTSAIFSHIFSRLGVDCHFSTAHHPESNGQSEIYVKAVTNALKSSLVHHSEDWADLLPFVNFALNSTVHEATRVSPFFATTCREPRQFADLTNPVRTSAQALNREEQTDLRQAITS